MEATFVVLLFGFIVWISVRNIRLELRGDDLSILPRAEEEFRTLVVNNEFPELSFDGRTAEVVDDRQEGISDNGTYTLHRVLRFARNEYGEYFYFISEGDGTPFFKHVTQANAKIALGKKYIEP
jgi:hypothetical protein